MAIIQNIADALGAHLEAIGLNVPEQTWARKEIRPPGAELEVPDVNFTGLEQAERQLGATDWNFSFPVRIWLDLRDPTTSQASLVDLLEQWATRLQQDPTLGSLVEEAKLTRAERVYLLDQQRPLVGYESTVDVLVLL